jgi:hypothetical protein
MSEICERDQINEDPPWSGKISQINGTEQKMSNLIL